MGYRFYYGFLIVTHDILCPIQSHSQFTSWPAAAAPHRLWHFTPAGTAYSASNNDYVHMPWKYSRCRI